MKTARLVLSSGGARGMAHIGVIEELLSRGYEITEIAGSSMGAVVGAMYCAGHLETYKNWLLTLSKTSVLRLFDITFTTRGFVKGDKIFNKLQAFTGDLTIEEFKIPFTAVASDLQSRSDVYFNSGKLYPALRASVAMPGVFTPLITEEHTLIDGGVLNPLPLNVIRPQAGDTVVAVNLNAPPLEIKKAKEPKKKTSPGIIDLLNISYDFTQGRLIEMTIEKYKPGIVVNIPRNICSAFDFHKAQQIIDAGREALCRAMEEPLKQ
jgi:NTE family protein